MLGFLVALAVGIFAALEVLEGVGDLVELAVACKERAARLLGRIG